MYETKTKDVYEVVAAKKKQLFSVIVQLSRYTT